MAITENCLRELVHQFGGNFEAAGRWVLQSESTTDVVDLIPPLAIQPHDLMTAGDSLWLEWAFRESFLSLW